MNEYDELDELQDERDYEIIQEANKEFDQKYLEEYRRGIWASESIEEIARSLPEPRMPGYLELMTYFQKYAELEISEFQKNIETTQDYEDRQYLSTEIEKLKKMRLLFSKKIETFKKENESFEQYDKTPNKRSIIYLTSSLGNPLLEEDLESIAREYLPEFKELIDMLREGDFTSDQRKYKMFNNNDVLRGLREVKKCASRVYFYHLTGDTVLAILGLAKRGDNPKSDKSRIVKRASASSKSIRKLKEELKDPTRKQELIMENNEITKRIYSFMQEKAIGGNTK